MSESVEVIVGAIGRAHGIRGDVAIDVRTDEPDRRFADGARLRTSTGGVLTVASSRWHSGRLLVHFVELADRTAVETARGQTLLVDVPADQTPDDTAEYYDRQLVGLAVLNSDGTPVGRVTAVLHLPLQDALEVELEGAEHQTGQASRIVPFVTALVPTVDLVAGHVRLAEVPGLLSDLPDDASQDPA
ncbi:MAG: ribosome maturation factor RimM [Propionibacteriaceae bacterium]